MLISALAKSCRLENDKVLTRLPIQSGLLDLLLFEIERKYRLSQPYLELLYKNIFLWAYYGLMRIGELTTGTHPLKAKDIHSANNKDKLLLILYSSKTHGKESRPQTIKIEANPLSDITKTIRRHFCPFKVGREYLAIRGNYSTISEPFFIFRDGTPVKPIHVRQLLKSLLKNLKLDHTLYSTHSFRIGRATDLQKAGHDIETIKKLGRWRSNAVYKYLRSL